MGLFASPLSPLHPRRFLSVFNQIPFLCPLFFFWSLQTLVKGQTGGFCWTLWWDSEGVFCRLSLGFPLKVVEEGGAIKVKSLEPPCFFCFFFYDWAFFYKLRLQLVVWMAAWGVWVLIKTPPAGLGPPVQPWDYLYRLSLRSGASIKT